MAVCWGKMERYNLVFRLSSLKNKFDTKCGNFLLEGIFLLPIYKLCWYKEFNKNADRPLSIVVL